VKYYSLNHRTPSVNFRDATLIGLAPDRGLYFPEEIPQISEFFLETIEERTNAEIALEVIRPYVGDSIPEEALSRIIEKTLSFPIPLVPVSANIYSLELFHGPTLAFKDIGARFMSQCLGYFSTTIREKVVVLVATSGDTGGAVASGFAGVNGVDVVILYPKGKVSPLQKLQMTTCGENIHAIEVNGTFDDCQTMVKAAFLDGDLKRKMFLTSANSINVARWLPQQFYYFFAWKQWKDKTELPVFVVPSGNFGNICAGMLAHASGLPVQHFVAACNSNDVVVRYLETNDYQPTKTISTISNAMDVGDPSNFVRVLELFGRVKRLESMFSAFSVDEEKTKRAIKECKRIYQYLLDPHGAVGFCALAKYQIKHSGKGIFLETAHPIKFREIVEEATGELIATSLQPVDSAGRWDNIDASNSDLRRWLISRFNSSMAV